MSGRRSFGVAIATALALISTLPVRAEVSLLDYLSIESGNDGPRKEKLQIYLAGVLEALLTFNELNRPIDVNLICIPPGTRLDLPAFQASLDQVVELTRAEQKDFAAYAEQANISVIGLTALNREFPCSDRDQPARDGAAP